MNIHIWPNGDWCYEWDLENYVHNKSDDFSTVFVEDSMDEDAIEELVQSKL